MMLAAGHHETHVAAFDRIVAIAVHERIGIAHVALIVAH